MNDLSNERQSLTEQLEHMTERWRLAEHRVSTLMLQCEGLASQCSVAEEQASSATSLLETAKESLEDASRIFQSILDDRKLDVGFSTELEIEAWMLSQSEQK
jgi:chromosome segregation ATPase